MYRQIIILSMGALLIGCSPKILKATPKEIIVEGGSFSEFKPIAHEHCAKYNKIAALKYLSPTTYVCKKQSPLLKVYQT